MGTLISLVVGILVTIVVSHYYWKRSVSKSLGVYGLLNSNVLAGIAADVRQGLHFRFRDLEVNELQQLVFLVANDGEKAIRDVMEPLCLTVPRAVAVLDASIIHRRPESLQVELRHEIVDGNGAKLHLRFPLLNKGEFFVAKLLLSGRLAVDSIEFTLLAEDLPRSLRVRALHPAAIRNAAFRIDWALAAFAGFLLLIVLWLCRWLYLLRQVRPDLFPIPLRGFHPTLDSTLLLVPGLIFILLLVVVAILTGLAAAFGGDFPPKRGRRFPLPRELQEAVFPYGIGADLTLKAPGWTDLVKETRPSGASFQLDALDQEPKGSLAREE